jgi:hypothetical protein
VVVERLIRVLGRLQFEAASEPSLVIEESDESPRGCYELGRKSHRNADSTVGLVPSRSTFPAFLSRF